MPVGGIKEKVLAAHRAGLKTIILPKRNEKDLDELPEQVRKDLKFVFAEQVTDVFNAALGAKRVPKVAGNGHGQSASDEEPEKAKTPRAAKKRTI